VAAQRSSWARLHADFLAATPGSRVTLEDLSWALNCVRSRAFSGPYGGARWALRFALLYVLVCWSFSAGRLCCLRGGGVYLLPPPTSLFHVRQILQWYRRTLVIRPWAVHCQRFFLHLLEGLIACIACPGPPWRSRAKLAVALLAAGAGSLTVLHVPLEQVPPMHPADSIQVQILWMRCSVPRTQLCVPRWRAAMGLPPCDLTSTCSRWNSWACSMCYDMCVAQCVHIQVLMILETGFK